MALLYALMDSAEQIELEHLDAAVALWGYCDDSARWLFSTYEMDEQESHLARLVDYIRQGGSRGRTRTEISAGHYEKHRSAAEISSVLAPLIHDGVVIATEESQSSGGRPTTRYVHHSLRNKRISERTR